MSTKFRSDPMEAAPEVAEADDADDAASLLEVEGNLLEAEEQYIVQQSNCVTNYAHGLAKGIEEKFPHADVYSLAARTEVGHEVKLYKMPQAAKPCTDCKKSVGPDAGRAWKSWWYCTACYNKY